MTPALVRFKLANKQGPLTWIEGEESTNGTVFLQGGQNGEFFSARIPGEAWNLMLTDLLQREVGRLVHEGKL